MGIRTSSTLAASAPRKPGDRLLTRLIPALAVSFFLKLLILALDLWPKHPGISFLLFTCPDIWILSGILIPNSTWLAPIARRFVTETKEVWLTIDDGPEPATTSRMLDLLDKHSAKATFFVIGRQVARYPELAYGISKRGHSLGNHTHTHPVISFWLAGRERTACEIDDCQTALNLAGVGRVAFFRPPAGIRTFFIPSVLAERNSHLVGWTGRGREQLAATTEKPLKRLKRHVKPGSILLLHESGKHADHRVALLSGLLDYLAANGYRCVIPSHDQLR